jgi:hypothetical protein
MKYEIMVRSKDYVGGLTGSDPETDDDQSEAQQFEETEGSEMKQVMEL